MDFHSLSRRELQTLCKKNKIPANQTNLAMADALQSLEMVEGIEEILNPSQSESTQSSIESQEMSDLTSPFVPPTGGRNTRRRNIAKEELGSVVPTTRTCRTARKNLDNDSGESQADAIGTPALVAQSNRNKGKMTSVCRKMDSQLKECVEEEEKKEALMTPAPLGAASRRRKVEETAVKHVYSTRRSVRLAEKTVEKLHKGENEDSEFLKKELLTNDGENEEIKSKEAPGDINEPSGITDVDATTIMEESSVNEDKSEFVSAEEIVLPLNLSYDVQQNDGITIMEESYVNEDQSELVSAEESVLPPNLSNDVQQNDVENTEELNAENEAQSQDEAADFVENILFETKDDFSVDDFSSNTDCHDEIEIEEEVYHNKDMDTEDDPDFDLTLVKFTELKLQKATKEVSPGKMLGDSTAAEADLDFIDHLANPVQLNKDEPDETEVPQLEESEKVDDSAIEAQLNEDGSEEIEVRRLQETEKAADMVPQDAQQYSGVDGAEDDVHSATLHMDADFPEKPSVTMKMATGFSDNKENIGSDGTKLVIMQDIVEVAKNVVENEDDLAELSVRKLTKMLKKKLQITNKSSKNEDGKEALSRPALQALPENRLLD